MHAHREACRAARTQHAASTRAGNTQEAENTRAARTCNNTRTRSTHKGGTHVHQAHTHTHTHTHTHRPTHTQGGARTDRRPFPHTLRARVLPRGCHDVAAAPITTCPSLCLATHRHCATSQATRRNAQPSLPPPTSTHTGARVACLQTCTAPRRSLYFLFWSMSISRHSLERNYPTS